MENQKAKPKVSKKKKKFVSKDVCTTPIQPSKRKNKDILFNDDEEMAKFLMMEGDAEMRKFKVRGRQMIILQAMQNGYPKSEIVNRCSTLWGVSEKSINHYISGAYVLMEEDDESIKHIRNLNKRRITDIYQRCVDNGDFKNAIKALETLNKTTGVYVLNDKELGKVEPVINQEINFTITKVE